VLQVGTLVSLELACDQFNQFFLLAFVSVRDF